MKRNQNNFAVSGKRSITEEYYEDIILDITWKLTLAIFRFSLAILIIRSRKNLMYSI